MKHMIIMALLCASMLAAEPAKPKPLSADDKLAVAQLQLQITQAQAQAERVLAKAREDIQALDKQYADLLAKHRAASGADAACGLNDRQDWVCPPAGTPPKPEVKK